MGKIKSKLVKRTARKLLKAKVEFNESFEKNKRVLADTMPSKKLRNQIAGYLSRIVKSEKIKSASINTAH